MYKRQVQYPAGQNGRTLVPVRLIAERLGASVTWVPETRQVILLREESTIVLTLGSATALVNGQAMELPGGVPAGVVKWAVSYTHLDVYKRQMLTFLFAALTMSGVQRAAQSIVVEVRRQFKEIAGIMEGKADPDYASCVDLCTKGALHEMVVPSLLAIVCLLYTSRCV